MPTSAARVPTHPSARSLYLDLVSHYVIAETGLGVGDTEACLIGATLGGIPIEGCDSVRAFWP